MKSYTNLLARDVLGAKAIISANPNNPNMIIILPLFDSGLFLFYSQKDRWKMKNIGLGSELVKSEKSNTKYINLVDGIYTDTYINDGSNIYSLNNTSFKDNHLYLDGCLIDIISENDIIEELRYQDSNGIRVIKFEYNNDYIKGIQK